MPARTAATTSGSISVHPSTPYALAFLSEYAQTLDALPLELSRNFADLRELDAVLSSAMAALNVKILNLIEMVENKEVSKEKRYWLLREIADEAAKLKLGGDDKIRVACQAADSLHAHSAHLTALLNEIPGLDPSIFIRKTAYPHVSPHAYSINAPYESSRRRRAANGSGLLVGSTDPSPSKKRKIVQDGDFEFVNGRSPRKEKTGESSSQARVNRGGGQRSRKNDRGGSPSESLLSVAVASHIPLQNGSAISNSRSSANNHISRNNSNQRRRQQTTQNISTAGFADTDLSLDSIASRKEQHLQPTTANSRSGAALLDDSGLMNGHERNTGARAAQDNMNSDIAISTNGRVSGSVTVATISVIANGDGSLVTNASDTPMAVEGDGDADNDDGKTYCICDTVSYGEMIGCDDDNCERQWFHLACLGLTAAPSGQWFCEECLSKRANKRNNRGGKKRSGGRNGGRARADANP